MPMIVTCPCGRQLQLDEQYAGTKVRCPVCQQIFQTPVRDIGDFQIENPAPPGEPMRASPRTAATVPAGQTDPSIFDLAPSHPKAPAPARPRSRPVVRHGEDTDSPKRSWTILRILDVCALLMLIGGFISLVLFLQALARASAPPSEVAGILVGVLFGTMLTVAGGLWFFFRLILLFRR